MKKDLNIRVKKLWSSQYNHGENVPDWYKLFLPFSPTREKVAFSFAKNLSGQLLDIGCGEGDLIINLSGYYKELDGVDMLDTRIKRGRKNIAGKNLNNIFLMVRNIEDGLQFSSRSFDVVICLSVIEYTFDPYFSVQEIAGVLKNGGTLILSVPNTGFVFERVKLLLGKLPNVANAPGWQGGRLHNFTQSSLSELLCEEGFEITNIVGSGFLNRLRSFWPSLLCGDLIFVCKKR